MRSAKRALRSTKKIQGNCSHCGGSLEFPAELVGTVAACPHCGQQAELLLARPLEEPTIPRRVLVWTGIAVLILLLGFAGVLYALKRSQAYVEQHKGKAGQAARP